MTKIIKAAYFAVPSVHIDHMKRICTLLLFLALVLSLAACSITDELMGEEYWELLSDEFGDVNVMEEELGEAAEQAADGMINIIDSLIGSNWEYPLVDAICSWRGYEDETWSWSEFEFKDPEDRSYHLGLDLKSASGSDDVLAAADGTVVYASASGDETEANGFHVVIEHKLSGKIVYSFYGHLADYKNLPDVGDSVSCGDILGTMGNTGASTGAHLHFAVYSKEGSYDPPGRAYQFAGDSKEFKGYVFYNPKYIVENDSLPD